MAYLKPAPELVSQDPQAFHRWRQLVTSWVCQLCGCTLNRRSILDPTCKTCRHIHVPKREKSDAPVHVAPEARQE